MIKLEVETYCQECPDFEPDVKKDDETQTFEYSMGFSKGFGLTPDIKIVHICNTTVMCKHRHKCSCMMERLEERQKEKKDGQD